ncbi:mannose-1-phosphate guanylyltransferase [Gracilinema caldarium]|nr:mannose-1-phosphate guanylyltransferase [Gracilinema caldarium]
MFHDCIIMAGGSGTRLWPASNSYCPKQFLNIPGGGTFFQAALERAFAVTEADGKVLIVTGNSHVPHVMKACESLPETQKQRVVVIPEPAGRNTAPAIACAAVYITRTSSKQTSLQPPPNKQVNPKAQAKHPVLVLTSDHIIEPLKDFIADALAAAELAKSDHLVVFGIQPSRPETGFGYIEAGPAMAALDARAFQVMSFREKPDLATAEEFLAKGTFFWNSGMFAFDVHFMLSQFRQHAPAILAPFEQLGQPDEDHVEQLNMPGPDRAGSQGGLTLVSRWPGLETAYNTVPSISIDYAIAEHCTSVAMVASRFQWTDVGSWDEYAKVLEKSGKTTQGVSDDTTTEQQAAIFTADSSNCFVDSDIPVALCGVEDLIVVVRSGKGGGIPSVLICKKGDSQQVKTIVEAIRKSNRGDLL